MPVITNIFFHSIGFMIKSYSHLYLDKPIEKVLVLIAPEGTTFSRDLKISFVAGSPTNLQSSPQLSLSEQYQQPSVQQYGSAYQALQPSYPYGQMPPAAPSLPQYLPYGAVASPGYRVMSASKTVEKKEESK